MKDAMVDLETLGTGTDAIILSVAVVLFDLDGNDDYDTLQSNKRSFYAVLDAEDQARKGRSITFSTIKWWMEQDKLAQAVFHEAHGSNEEILRALNLRLGDCTETVLWGNGSAFDIPILRSLYDDYEVSFPFRFWNENDLRTLKRLAGGKSADVLRGIAHNALDDAQYQVLAAQEYYRRVTETRE